MSQIKPPTPRPCSSCPYRQDVPSGVWSEAEYAKLPEYDRPTSYQPMMVFQCHQNDRDDPQARICGGWAACHKDEPLLALRVATAIGVMDVQDAVAALDYETTVSLFASGQEAYEHGVAEIDDPSPEACALVEEIARKRGLGLS